MNQTQTSRIPELDGLRGIAILLVLAWHLLPAALVGAPHGVAQLVNFAIRFAWSGVDLFFVLSGFLLGGILLDHSDSPRYFSTFYLRRAYRILPAYVITVAAFFLLRALNSSAASNLLFARPMPLVSYLTFTQNFAMARSGCIGAQWLGPTWSLAVEEQFYLVLPLLIRFAPRRQLSVVLVLLALAAPLTRLVLFLSDPNWSLSAYVLMPARADALMLGVLAAVVVRSQRIWLLLQERQSLVYFALAVTGAGILAMALQHQTFSSRAMVLIGFSILALFYTCLLVLSITGLESTAVRRVLRWRVLQRCGVLAYGLYLFHTPVAGLSAAFIQPPAIAQALALVVTFVIASLSWAYLEKPLIRIGHNRSY